MSQTPNTRLSLLVRLRDPSDHAAWSEFVELYAPLIYGWARKKGLQDADAADVTQEVFRSLASLTPAGAYDPQRGAFRGWLYTVTRNKILDFLARRPAQVIGSGDTAVLSLLEAQPDSRDADQWDYDYRRRLFAWAAERIRPRFEDKTWQAFWQSAVEGRAGEVVAEALGLSVGAVYVAKNRVLARLRQEIQSLEEGESYGEFMPPT